MPDGLRKIHQDFQIIDQGSWGNKESVAYFLTDKTRAINEETAALVENNDPLWPIHVWIIAKIV
jgi:hypothetical protein